MKPNLLTAAAPGEAVTTHPALMRELALMVRDAGGQVYIGDSPGSGPPERVYKISGLRDVIEETGAELLLFDGIRHVPFSGKRKSLLAVADALDSVDLIINVAKLKTHTLTGMTAAVKNIFGCIVDKNKQRLHFEYPLPMDFAHLLLDICLAVNPAFSIVDAVVSMEGTGPRSGNPRHTGLLLAGTNAIAVDTVAAAVTGFQPGEVTTLAAAKKRGLPGAGLKDIRIEGLSPDDARIHGFDRGAVGSGRPGRLLARLPASWVRNRARRRRPYPYINPDTCTGCGICLEHCPAQVIRLEGDGAVIPRSSCIRCYCCQELCPSGAVNLLTR